MRREEGERVCLSPLTNSHGAPHVSYSHTARTRTRLAKMQKGDTHGLAGAAIVVAMAAPVLCGPVVQAAFRASLRVASTLGEVAAAYRHRH